MKLCFLLGHKWDVVDTCKRSTRVDGLLSVYECTFLKCSRCGKEKTLERKIYHEVR